MYLCILQGHLVAVEEDQPPLAEVELGEIRPINWRTSSGIMWYPMYWQLPI
jgi:hypothetical protein